MRWLKAQAEEGEPAAALLRLHLLRLAGAYVTESCDAGEAWSRCSLACAAAAGVGLGCLTETAVTQNVTGLFGS